MTLKLIEALIGIVLTGLVLTDIFCTILIPGPTRGPFRIAIRIRDLGLPLWRLLSRNRAGGRRQRLSNSFAPLLFFLIFATWIGLLWLGFGLVFHALADSFKPRLGGFDEALFVAGSSLLTLGVSEVDALGPARWLVLWAALSGFGLITAAFTYILQIQSSWNQREAIVLTLVDLTDQPLTGIGLLESFAALGLRGDLPAFFGSWRDWSAAIRQSHLSFPVLVYFHSIDAESDWLTALHAVLDAATIVMVLTDEPSSGAAALMHRAGSRTVLHLCDLFDLRSGIEVTPDPANVAQLLERLVGAGFVTTKPIASASARLFELRGDYAGGLASLSRHLGAEETELLPGRSRPAERGDEGSTVDNH